MDTKDLWVRSEVGGGEKNFRGSGGRAGRSSLSGYVGGRRPIVGMGERKSVLIPLIVAPDAATRDTALRRVCGDLSADELRAECAALDAFWRESENLYERVRALFFLYAIYRFHLPPKLESEAPGLLSFEGFEKFLERRFSQAIEVLLAKERDEGLTDTLCSAYAQTYFQLGLQNLADQVRRSVRTLRGEPVDVPDGSCF